MLFYWPKLLAPFCLMFNFPVVLSMGWYCGARDFGLIECKSLSPSIALPTFFIIIIIIISNVFLLSHE